MESESQYSYSARYAEILTLSFGSQGQVATEEVPELSLNLQLNSWGQAVNQVFFDVGKAINGSIPLDSATGRGLGTARSSPSENLGRLPKGLNMIDPEEGICLTLGSASAFASSLSSSRCDGLAHDTAMSTHGNKTGHVNVDLGLGLSTRQECHSTAAPVSTQGPISEAAMETSKGWQELACRGGVHDGSIPVHRARVLENISSVHKSSSGNVAFRTAKETDLQLGLSESSLLLNSDSASLDVQDTPVETSIHDHIPVVDEGSTSARLMESGGNYVPFLECKLVVESSGSSQIQACMMPVRASEPDTSELPTSCQVPVDNSGFVSALENSRKASVGVDAASLTSHGHLAQTSNASCPTTERGTKKCKFKGCFKGARGASGLCIAHGGGRRCQKLNCSKGAEGRTMFCKAHGGGRRCQRLGCIKSAEGKTDFCIAHGGGRRCTHEGCSKAARGRSGLCIRHGGGKRCQREDCTKSAEGYSGLCISHGGGRRCQFPDCGKGAQGSTKFCKGHGGGRRCEFEGCNKGAEGSTPLCKAHGGGKRCTFRGGICTKSVHGGTAFCVAHGGGKRCSVPGCTKSARGRTDFCVRHGGGKRCKFEHCDKSAQGSTDYCKAHGGGKRCLWGQEGSMYDSSLFDESSIGGLTASCEKFARGKAGLCSAHIDLLEQYHSGVSSIPTLQGISSERASSKEHVQPHSDVSEPISQLDEELESMAEQQLKSMGEGSLRSQEQLSSPVVFKARFASRRCVATDAAWQDIGDSCGSVNSQLKEFLNVSVPGHNLALCNRVVSSTRHVLQTSNPGLPEDSVVPFSRIQAKAACPDAWKQRSDPMGHASCSEDPEERVHGGGHFMALCSKKTSA